MKLLAKQLQESYKNEKICYICEKTFENKYANDKKYYNVRDHCHYTGKYKRAVDSIYHLTYSVPQKIPLAFHNGCIYDYHFFIKQLTEEFLKNLLV